MNAKQIWTFACAHCQHTFDCHDREFGEALLAKHLQEKHGQIIAKKVPVRFVQKSRNGNTEAQG